MNIIRSSIRVSKQFALSAFIILATTTSNIYAGTAAVTDARSGMDLMEERLSPIVDIIFAAVLLGSIFMVGFEIMQHRKNEEKRSESLGSIFWIGVALVIVAGGGWIAKVIMFGI